MRSQAGTTGPVGDRVVQLSWRVRESRGAPEVRELVGEVDDHLEELLDDGQIVPIAMAAWALSSRALPQGRPLVSLLESLIDERGKIASCRFHCREAMALAYLVLSERAPAKAKIVGAQLGQEL